MELDKQIGPEAKLKVEAGADGVIKLSLEYEGKQLGGGAFIQTSVDQLMDALAEVIPGDSAVEKSVVSLAKLAIKSALGAA